MAEIVFQYEGQNITIQCNKNQKMLDICNNLSNKINTNLDSLVFLYGGSQLKFDKKESSSGRYVTYPKTFYCETCGDFIYLSNDL